MAGAATRKSASSQPDRSKAAATRSSKATKSPEPSIEQLVDYYRDMLVIRRFEEEAVAAALVKVRNRRVRRRFDGTP